MPDDEVSHRVACHQDLELPIIESCFLKVSLYQEHSSRAARCRLHENSVACNKCLNICVDENSDWEVPGLDGINRSKRLIVSSSYFPFHFCNFRLKNFFCLRCYFSNSIYCEEYFSSGACNSLAYFLSNHLCYFLFIFFQNSSEFANLLQTL